MLNPDHPDYRERVLDPAIALRGRVRSQLAAVNPSEYSPAVQIEVRD